MRCPVSTLTDKPIVLSSKHTYRAFAANWRVFSSALLTFRVTLVTEACVTSAGVKGGGEEGVGAGSVEALTSSSGVLLSSCESYGS